MIISIEINEESAESTDALVLTATSLLKALRYSCGNTAESLAAHEISAITFVIEQFILQIPVSAQIENNFLQNQDKE